MKNRKPFAKLTLITQFGVSLISPILLCLFVSIWIQERFQIGYWVVIIGILLGIAAMMNTFYRFYKKYTSEEDKEKAPESNYHH
jgi:hypothetical protein